MDGEKKRLEMAGTAGAIEESYRQGLIAHSTRHNKVSMAQRDVNSTTRCQ